MRSAALKLSAQKPPQAPPLAERGRILYVKDVQALFGKNEDGSWVRSEWWIRTSCAPEYRRKLGRTPYWFESELVKWLDEQGREAP